MRYNIIIFCKRPIIYKLRARPDSSPNNTIDGKTIFVDCFDRNNDEVTMNTFHYRQYLATLSGSSA